MLRSRRLPGTLCAVSVAFGAAAWVCSPSRSLPPQALTFAPGPHNLDRRNLIRSPLEATTPAARVARCQTGTFTGASWQSTRTSAFSGFGLCAAIMVLLRSSVTRSAEGDDEETTTLEGKDFVGFNKYVQKQGREHWTEMAKKGRSKQDKYCGFRITGAPGYRGFPYSVRIPKVRWMRRFKVRIKLRNRMFGTPARPRVAIFRAHKHLHVQVMDDTLGTGVTLLTISTRQQWFREELRKEEGSEWGQERTHTMEAAERLAKHAARKMLEMGITNAVGDRGGFPYDGRVKAFMEGLRAGGIQI